MRKPINVTWEDIPVARIVSIEWDCGCLVFSDEPASNRFCRDHIVRRLEARKEAMR